MSVSVVLCLGSNTPDRRLRVEKACEWLASKMKLIAASSIYDTPPFSGMGSDYVNMVVEVTTDLPLQDIDLMCKEYELRQGRDAECRQTGDVPIDMDVVVYGTEIVRPRDFSRYYFVEGYKQIKA